MEKSVQITLIIVLGIMMVSGLSLYTINSFAPSQENKISVNGVSSIKAVPDLVGVYFNVETKADTSEEATEENAEIVEDLIVKVLMLGFERKDIQTQNFNVYPNYDWSNGERKENGYTARHQIKVEMSTEDSGKIGEVIDAGVEAGAGVNYINFELSQENQNKYQAQAMKLAAQDAKTKAEAVAEGFGKELGKLVSTSVGNFGYSPWRVYSGSGIMEDTAIEAKQAATNIQPSEEEITASVNAVFKLK